MLWIGIGLVIAYIAAVLLSDVAWRFGECGGGIRIMDTSRVTIPPVVCTHIPDVLGTIANGLINSVFAAIIFSPLWIGCLALLVILPELSERNRQKREKD